MYLQPNFQASPTNTEIRHHTRRSVRVLPVSGQGGDFTVKGFAEKCGFKVTHNLRRRLAELVKEGLLSYTPIYNGANHLVGLYHANPNPQKTDESKYPF